MPRLLPGKQHRFRGRPDPQEFPVLPISELLALTRPPRSVWLWPPPNMISCRLYPKLKNLRYPAASANRNCPWKLGYELSYGTRFPPIRTLLPRTASWCRPPLTMLARGTPNYSQWRPSTATYPFWQPLWARHLPPFFRRGSFSRRCLRPRHAPRILRRTHRTPGSSAWMMESGRWLGTFLLHF